jgi:hypothetical protein
MTLIVHNGGTPIPSETMHEDGQQGFGQGFNGRYVASPAVALNQAKTLVMPQGNIYLVNIETGDWRAKSMGTKSLNQRVGRPLPTGWVQRATSSARLEHLSNQSTASSKFPRRWSLLASAGSFRNTFGMCHVAAGAD